MRGKQEPDTAELLRLNGGDIATQDVVVAAADATKVTTTVASSTIPSGAVFHAEFLQGDTGLLSGQTTLQWRLAHTAKPSQTLPQVTLACPLIPTGRILVLERHSHGREQWYLDEAFTGSFWPTADTRAHNA